MVNAGTIYLESAEQASLRRRLVGLDIGVKFIEDDEIEMVSITHNGLNKSILPGHEQLQHEIGEKNIGTELLDSFSRSCPVYRSKVGRSTRGSPD